MKTSHKSFDWILFSASLVLIASFAVVSTSTIQLLPNDYVDRKVVRNECLHVGKSKASVSTCVFTSSPSSNFAQIFRTHFGRKQLNRKTHFKANNFSKSLPLNDFEIYFKQTKAHAHRSNSNTHRRTNSVLRKPEYAARKFIMLKNQSEKEVCVILFSFEMDFWPIWKFDDV